jgi:hypothetical protein
MDEQTRQKIEDVITRKTTRFPQVTEIVYNDEHPNPDGPATARDSYFVLGGKYNPNLEKTITKLQKSIEHQFGEYVGLTWFPVMPEHKRKIFPRKA